MKLLVGAFGEYRAKTLQKIGECVYPFSIHLEILLPAEPITFHVFSMGLINIDVTIPVLPSFHHVSPKYQRSRVLCPLKTSTQSSS